STAATTTTAATQQGDAVGLDLGRVALVPVFVVPLPGLQTTLDVDLFAFRQVLLERFRLFAPEHDAMPFGLFLPLLVLVVPDLGRGEIECGNCGATGCIAKLR